jgi:hypothetical protein
MERRGSIPDIEWPSVAGDLNLDKSIAMTDRKAIRFPRQSGNLNAGIGIKH